MELVYIILKGITQFTYIQDGKWQTNYLYKANKKMVIEADGEDVRLTFFKIKIKNPEIWSQLRTD